MGYCSERKLVSTSEFIYYAQKFTGNQRITILAEWDRLFPANNGLNFFIFDEQQLRRLGEGNSSFSALALAAGSANFATTGGITHKISPEIDSERNKLVTDTARAGVLDGYYWVNQFHTDRQGRNGGGDPYFTDGRLAVGVIDVRR